MLRSLLITGKQILNIIALFFGIERQERFLDLGLQDLRQTDGTLHFCYVPSVILKYSMQLSCISVACNKGVKPASDQRISIFLR